MKHARPRSTVLLLAPLAAFHAAAVSVPQPNMLLILADDIGWGDVQCYNPQGKIPTPHVNRLAREGMIFTDAHEPAALCAPSRYSMLTGNYPSRSRDPGGVWGFNVPSAIWPGQQTVASMLRTAGYRTAMFGKAGIGGFWANSPNGQYGDRRAPIEWGFDYSFLLPRGHQSTPHAFYENGVRVEGEWDTGKVGERLLAKASSFLDDVVARNKAAGKPQPFYMHFCTDGAHAPYGPVPTLAGEPLKGVTKITDHTDMVYETGLLTGQLIEALEKRGLLDNTLIVYTSDNGGLPYDRRFGHDAIAGLRGRKSYIFEGGTRAPFVVCWPGKIPAGTVRHQSIGAHDLVATALELAGARVPAGQALDSVGLVPVLLGQRDDSQPVRDSLLVESGRGRAWNDDDGFRAWKVGDATRDDGQRHAEEVAKKMAKSKERRMAHALYEGDRKLVFDFDGQPAALYNLASDLAEDTNLIDSPEQAGRIRKMANRYQEIRKSKRSVATAGAFPPFFPACTNQINKTK